MTARRETKRKYTLRLPGNAEPQVILFSSGLTGYGLRGRIAGTVPAIKIATGKEKPDPQDVQIFTGEGEQRREIRDNENVHATIPEDQVVIVEVTAK